MWKQRANVLTFVTAARCRTGGGDHEYVASPAPRKPSASLSSIGTKNPKSPRQKVLPSIRGRATLWEPCAYSCAELLRAVCFHRVAASRPSGSHGEAQFYANPRLRAIGRMSASGQKQTCAAQKNMSALPPKADMCSATKDVRFVPIADIVIRSHHRHGTGSQAVRISQSPLLPSS